MLAGVLALLVLALLGIGYAIWYLGLVLWAGGEWLMTWYHRRREARIARMEAELDRTQDELRSTILRLADALGVEAHDARKALIRESFLASGTAPERPE